MIQEYCLEKMVGHGSFSVVYVAKNTYLPETVAIKEFLPSELADRVEGTLVVPRSDDLKEVYEEVLNKFLMEARTLYELAQPLPHKNIVRVMRYIEANGTAYMVMDYEKGEPLTDKLKDPHLTMPEKELSAILLPLLDGLEKVHDANIIHRDIKPDNIIIRPDGSPVLIDFGAARRRRPGGEKTQFPMFTPNYAAPEQYYDLGEQGKWTDIYELGATLYRAVTGKVPTNAAERLRGKDYQPAVDAAADGYTPAFLAAIDSALALQPQDRPQNIAEWRALFKQQSDDKTVVYSGGTSTPPLAETHESSIPANSPSNEGRRRLRPLFYGIAALGLTALGVIAVLFWLDNEPETSSAPSIDMATIRLNVERVAGEFECAQVKTTVDGNGQVLLNGYVSSLQDRMRLLSDVSKIPGVNKVIENMEVHTKPFCEVIGLLTSVKAPLVDRSDKVVLQTNSPGNDFKQGDLLIVYAKTTEAFPGYFYVDSFNSYGEVLHMLPSPIADENEVNTGQQVTLGNKPCPECYKTSPPHGRSLIVAISSTEPLFDTEREEVEDFNNYLPALRAGLQRLHAKGGKIISQFEYITTHK
jgi:serine/threonine protein kinase